MKKILYNILGFKVFTSNDVVEQTFTKNDLFRAYLEGKKSVIFKDKTPKDFESWFEEFQNKQ